MFNKRGEISTLVVLGVLSIIGIATLISSTIPNNRQTLQTRASENCRNNPEAPPDGGFTWVANCSSTCTTNADCPKNTSDSGNVNPETSNWCYGFAEGAKCLQLQKGSVTNPIQNEGTQNTNTPAQSGTSNAPCDKAEGCGGSCNASLNTGCGYGGCRAWEQCMNNSCFDTTNLGSQPAGPTACGSLATAGSSQNTKPQVQPTSTNTGNTQTNTNTNTGSAQTGTNPTPTTSPNTTDGRCTYIGDIDCITLTPKQTFLPFVGNNNTPTPTLCRSGQIRCLGSNVCVDSREDCPSSPQRPSSQPQMNPNAKIITPTPTRNQLFIPGVGNINPLKTTPTPTKPPVRFEVNEDIIIKSCLQNGEIDIIAGCYLEQGLERLVLNKI